MRLLALGLAVTVAGCGLSARDGQFLCPDGECPAGFACVAGVCRSALDAPGLDAPGSDVPELDVPGIDAPDTPLDTPEIDAPVVPESCVPGPTRRPADEDSDGRIDEGCAYHFGTPHAVLGAMPLGFEYFGVDLTADGLTMLTAPSRVGEPFFITRRGALHEAFGNAVPQASSADPGRTIDSPTIRGDGAEVIVQSTGTDEISRLYRSVAVGGTWPRPTRIAELTGTSSEEEIHPYLRRDGLELLFVRRPTAAATPTTIHWARRASVSATWTETGSYFDGSFPTLSPDGLTLFYTDPSGALRYTERASVDAPFSPATTAALSHPIPDRSIVRPVMFPGGREVLFVHRSDGMMPPPEAPRANSIFRMEVCRDAECAPVTITGCPGVVGDLHCYRMGTGSTTYDGAAVRCMTDEHLVSIHSRAEATLVRDTWLNAWLGIRGRTWASREPFLYEEFMVDPTGSECAHTGVGWPIVDCAAPTRTVVCERDLWPVFVDP